jgi:hypothetical protein
MMVAFEEDPIMSDRDHHRDADDALVPGLTEGERQAVPGKLAGVMSHQDPRRQHELDKVLGRSDAH